MRTLVVFESAFGNTRKVAEAIADGLQQSGQVDVVEVGHATPTLVDSADLLVLGGPTHAFGMSRPSTREDAVRQGADPGSASHGGLREWLPALRDVSPAPAAAAFDTRVRKVRRLPGSAARGAAKELRRLGYRLTAEPESFYVEDVRGPLAQGELERARLWGNRLGALVAPSHQPG